MSLKEIKIFLLFVIFLVVLIIEEKINIPIVEIEEHHIYSNQYDLNKMFENFRENNYIPLNLRIKKNSKLE